MIMLCSIVLLTSISISSSQEDPVLHYVTPTFLNESKLSCISCQRRCGEISKPLIYNKDYSFCSCDSRCVDYGDCCPDYTQVCYKTNTVMLADNMVIPSYCKRDAGGGFLLINHCPYSSVACQVRDDIITTLIPVTDPITGLHYVHTLCASCNSVSKMKIWDANVTTEYKKASLRDSIQKESKPEVYVSLPDNVPPKRWCVPTIPKYKIIKSCEDEWANEQIRTLCEDGNRGYVNVKWQMYFNIYCALCNKVPVEEIQCETGSLSRSPYTRFGPTYSFQLLFSVNGASGIHFTGICKSDEVYIQAEDKCRKTMSTAEVSTPFIQLNVTLYHKKSHLTPVSPVDVAGSLVSPLEKIYPNLNFTIGACNRNWKDGYDHIYLYAREAEDYSKSINNKSPKNNPFLLTMGRNMSTFLASNSFGFKKVEVGLMVSVEDANMNNCTNVLYNVKDIKADSSGVVTLPGKVVVRPGYYKINNATITACVGRSPSVWDDILGWVTFISMTLSVICIIIHITLNYIYKPKKRWRTTGLACCLLVTFVTFLMTPILKHEDKACYGAGVVLHLSFMASFCWMNYISIDIYLALSTVQLQKSNAQKRSDMWKYLMPFLPAIAIVVMTVVIERLTLWDSWKAKYGFGPLCWIQEFNVVMYLFILPGGISVLITALFTILCSCKLFCLWRTTRNAVAKERNYFMMFLKLAAMTGTGWCVGFVAVPTGNPVLLIVFVSLTATQGIWLLLVVWGSRCKKIVRKMQRKASSSSVRTKDTPLTGTSL